jgi:hypothetical protein
VLVLWGKTRGMWTGSLPGLMESSLVMTSRMLRS